MKHWTKPMMAAVGAVVLVVHATPATADCVTDDECGAGQVCVAQQYDMPTCDVAFPDCEDGDEECLARIEKAMADCMTTEVVTKSSCEPAPCETDADCGENMVCVEYVEEWCSGSAEVDCDENGDCTEIVEEQEPVCGSDVFKECAHPYEASCVQDADCGEGFSCVPTEICSCSAGAGTATDGVNEAGEETIGAPEEGGSEPPSPEGEPVEAPVEPECSCEPTGENHCELQAIACAADDDCPQGMICDTAEVSMPCATTEDGDVDCPDVEVTSQCRPEGWYRDDSVSAGDAVKESDGNDPAAPETDNGDESVDQGTAPGEDQVEGNPAPSGTDNIESDEAAPGADDSSPNESVGEADSKSTPSADGPSSGGCSVVAPAAGSSSAGALFILLGLLAVAERRQLRRSRHRR